MGHACLGGVPLSLIDQSEGRSSIELEVQLIGRYYDNHTDSKGDQLIQGLVR